MRVTLLQVQTLLELVGVLATSEITDLVSCSDAENLTGVDRATWFRRIKAGRLKEYRVRGVLCMSVDEIRRKYPGAISDDAQLPVYKLAHP